MTAIRNYLKAFAGADPTRTALHLPRNQMMLPRIIKG